MSIRPLTGSSRSMGSISFSFRNRGVPKQGESNHSNQSSNDVSLYRRQRNQQLEHDLSISLGCSDDDDDDYSHMNNAMTMYNNRSDNNLGNRYSKNYCANDQLTNKMETRVVFHLKLLVLVILISATIVISYICYRYTVSKEINELEVQLSVSSQKIMSVFETEIIHKLGYIPSSIIPSTTAAATLSNGRRQVQEQQINQNQKWPFITISSLDQHVAMANALSGGAIISLQIIPIISVTNRVDWEFYSAQTGS